MLSHSSTVPVDDIAPVSRGAALAAEPGRIVAEFDPDRETLTITLLVFDAAGAPGAQPVQPKDFYGLLLADDASTGQLPVRPTWDNHTYSLEPSRTLTVGRNLHPLPSMRYALALSVGADVDLADYRVEVLVGKHGRKTC